MHKSMLNVYIMHNPVKTFPLNNKILSIVGPTEPSIEPYMSETKCRTSG